MTKPKASTVKYWVPILALIVIAVQFVIVNTSNLTKWKGGGFGMYSEVHYYYNDVYVLGIHPSLDSIQAIDINIANSIKDVKRFPSKAKLKKLAGLVSKYSTNDTITVQVWKPLIDSKNATYSRELINQFQFKKQ